MNMQDSYITTDGRTIGAPVMEMKNITLRFGGVVAIKDISFDIREGEIRAIIGPNGAGKSSMLNVINGFYHPQEGEVWFRGAKRKPMKPHQIAKQGLARTFQNIALFKGMSTLDNIMTGRLTHMKSNMLSQMAWWGKAQEEETANREVVEKIIDFLEIPLRVFDTASSFLSMPRLSFKPAPIAASETKVTPLAVVDLPKAPNIGR